MTDPMKSSGAYAPDKALAHPDRLHQLREGRQPYPIHLHLVISDLCDLDCPGCAYRMSGYSSNQLFNDASGAKNAHNPNRRLPAPLVRSILDDCVTMGVKAVEFTGGGEPTIHPEAPMLLEYAQAKRRDTALITNGLHMARMGPAATKTKWLRISIDAATPETYAKVRPSFGNNPKKSRDNFYLATAAVAFANDERRRQRTDCVIGFGFVVQRDNWREILDAARLAKKLGADNIRISGLFTPDGADYHADYRLEAEELERAAVRELNDEKFKVYARFHEKVEDLSARPDYPTCWYQHMTTYIGGDGHLYRCCVTSYNKQGLIGNVATSGFKALWDSSTKDFRFRYFDARSCDFCQFNDRNRAIEKAVNDPTTKAPDDLTHENFV